MKKLLLIAAIAGTVASAPALAADYSNKYGNQCIPLVPADLLNVEDNATLTEMVVDMMNEAVSAADDEDIISYSRPVFVWASEAKVACGKAFGYLQSDYRDEQYLNKCECFYERMQSFLN